MSNEEKSPGQPGRLQNQPPEGAVCVGTYSRPNRAHEHGLVILAMGLSYWLIPDEGKYALYVQDKYAEPVVAQIDRYERENRLWPPREEVLPGAQGSTSSLVLFVITLWTFFIGADRAVVEAGLSSSAFLDGEWWRPVTALTLHGDWGHLMGNTVGGICFMILVFRFAGYGLGWLAVIVAGTLGNVINILILGEGHRSLGASTAVFAALGLVVGFRLMQAHRSVGWRWPRQLWIPLVGGLILLGMMGAGGERTDVMAHVWGFIAGGFSGGLLGYCRLDVNAEKLPQKLFAVLAVIVVAASWIAAYWYVLR